MLTKSGHDCDNCGRYPATCRSPNGKNPLCRHCRDAIDKDLDDPYIPIERELPDYFYDELEGAAFLAQLVFLVNRYHQQSRLLQRDLFEERVICDYMFEKDKIYAYQTLTDDELVVYDRIYSILAERVAKPDLVIYLQISLPTLLRRINKEGSDLEKNIAEKYLEDVLGAFDYFFFNYQVAPLLVVRADELDFDREEDIDDLVAKITQMKKSPLFYVPLSKSTKSGK